MEMGMNWRKFPELPPKIGNEDNVPCLCIRKGRRNFEQLVWSHHHQCWDDADGDDYNCDPEAVEYWFPEYEIDLPEKEVRPHAD